MSFTTSDYSLDGQIWTIRLYKKSTYSIVVEQEGEYLFDIEFRDICWDSVLISAEFEFPDYLYDLWQFQSIFYSTMDDQSQGSGYCGGYTTDLEYIAGPVFDPITGGADLSHYT